VRLMQWIRESSYEIRIGAIFVALLLIYLAIANFVLAPLGYYGTQEAPRFADPWIARGETILDGGVLYEDVFTSTPPLMNYLLIPPVIFSSWFGHINPWATLAFMVYFSLFNLLIAYALLYTAKSKAVGYRWALYYLLNPLTFGNTILRRQDESVLVAFFALAFMFIVFDQHVRAAVVMGLSLLVKLTGGMMVVVAFLTTRKWQYVIIPAVVFLVIFAPFWIRSGESAVFWDVNKQHTEHPFQFGGVSLPALWLRWRGGDASQILTICSALFFVGLLLALGWIAWKPVGIFENLLLLTTTVFLLSPKLHCGYFSMSVYALTPLISKYRIRGLFFGFATLALLADMYKWPIENFPLAFGLMVATYILLIIINVKIQWISHEKALNA
jgi:hypothetical protein